MPGLITGVLVDDLSSRISHEARRNGIRKRTCMQRDRTRTWRQFVLTLPSRPIQPSIGYCKAKMGSYKNARSHLPMSKPSVNESNSGVDNPRRHLTRRRILAALLLLLPITLLLRPVTTRYTPSLPSPYKDGSVGGIPSQSLEERVRHILSHTPLIGTSHANHLSLTHHSY